MAISPLQNQVATPTLPSRSETTNVEPTLNTPNVQQPAQTEAPVVPSERTLQAPSDSFAAPTTAHGAEQAPVLNAAQLPTPQGQVGAEHPDFETHAQLAAEGNPTLLSLLHDVTKERQKVNAGLANGLLTPAEAKHINAKLDGLEHKMLAKAAPGQQGAQAQGAHAPHAQAFKPGNGVTKKMMEEHQALQKRHDHAEERIDRALDNGTLTHVEAKAMKAELKKSRDLMQAMKPAEGLTQKEKATVESRLQSTDKKLELAARDNKFNPERRLESMKARIDLAVQTGKLNEKDATTMREQLKVLETRVETSMVDGKIEREDVMAMAASFDNLDQQFDGQTNGGAQQRGNQGTLDERIEGGLADGRLSPEQAAQFKDELNAIMGSPLVRGQRLNAFFAEVQSALAN